MVRSGPSDPDDVSQGRSDNWYRTRGATVPSWAAHEETRFGWGAGWSGMTPFGVCGRYLIW